MSKRRKYRSDGGFVQLHRIASRSAAWASLSPRAGWLLIKLMDGFDGNNNRITMSVREARQWLKCRRPHARAAFAELETKGFIRCEERGSFTRKIAHSSVWVLTMYGANGQRATLDFVRWQPESPESTSQNSERGDHCGYATGTTVGTFYRSTILGRPRPATLPDSTPTASDATSDATSPATAPATSTPTTTAPPKTADLRRPKNRQKRSAQNSGTGWPAIERRAARLSQRELAERADLSRGFIASLERGDRRPTADVRARIERALAT